MRLYMYLSQSLRATAGASRSSRMRASDWSKAGSSRGPWVPPPARTSGRSRMMWEVCLVLSLPLQPSSLPSSFLFSPPLPPSPLCPSYPSPPHPTPPLPSIPLSSFVSTPPLSSPHLPPSYPSLFTLTLPSPVGSHPSTGDQSPRHRRPRRYGAANE